jgi:hypothetical protein
VLAHRRGYHHEDIPIRQKSKKEKLISLNSSKSVANNALDCDSSSHLSPPSAMDTVIQMPVTGSVQKDDTAMSDPKCEARPGFRLPPIYTVVDMRIEVSAN